MRKPAPAVDGLRSQNGEDLALKTAGDGFSLLIIKHRVWNNFDPLGGKTREQFSGNNRRVLVERRLRLCPDRVHLLDWSAPIRTPGADARVDLSLDARDPDHEELVKIYGEDCRKLDSLQERVCSLFSFKEDAAVEVEPTQFTVDEHLGLERRQCSAVGFSGRAIRSDSSRVPTPIARHGPAPARSFCFRLRHLDALIRHASGTKDLLTSLPAPRRLTR
jgi:hypothetical protein